MQHYHQHQTNKVTGNISLSFICIQKKPFTTQITILHVAKNGEQLEQNKQTQIANFAKYKPLRAIEEDNNLQRVITFDLMIDYGVTLLIDF